MNDLDASAFVALFKEAFLKCFGHRMINSLSETESKLFAGKIFDATGLVIGSKSVKNYSSYILNSPDAKEENPSIATLDTLARYVLNIPYTDEVQRKNKESHYPYWFQYKNQFYRSLKEPVKKRMRVLPAIIFLVIALIITSGLIFLSYIEEKPGSFTETFQSVVEDSLISHGWLIQSKDTIYWNRRGEKPGHLGLFTLKGDNWPDSSIAPGIKNLLLRKISGDCFTAEIRLSDFIPTQNWQQAGVLLLEDTTFTGKSLRLSVAYNSFFGGYMQKPEIIIQAITSQGKGSKPEEVVHKSLFTLENKPDSLVINNLKKSALRIEKQGKKFRLLYTAAPVENSAFKEAVSQEFAMKPKYIGIFALKGQVVTSMVIPAYFKFFSFVPEKCN